MALHLNHIHLLVSFSSVNVLFHSGAVALQTLFCWMACGNEGGTGRHPSRKTKRPPLLVFVDGASSWA